MAALLNPRVWLWLAACAAVAFVLAFTYRAGKATVRADFEAYKTQQAEQRLLALRAQTLATTKALNDAHAQTVAAEAAAATASDAAGRLRARVAAFAKQSARPGAGQQSADPIGVLADVLNRHDDALQRVAVYADRLRVAGLACERISDGLQPAKP